MPDATTLVAIGREKKRYTHYECGTWFLIRPALSSREFSVFAEERKADEKYIKFMAFVSNDHIMTQFNKVPEKDDNNRIKASLNDKKFKQSKKTIVFGPNGLIKPQQQEV